MGLGSAACRDDQSLEGIEASMLQLLSSLTLAVFLDFGPRRFSRLLDAIAENEFFHELTMLD